MSRPADRHLALGGLLGLALCLAYAGALATPFQFDDFQVVVDNPAVASWSAWWQSMPGIRPLLKASYTFNGVLSPAPWGFHLFNLGVHALNAGLVWALARRWVAALAPDERAPTVAGWWVALLFALHPAATEAVTYVSGRSVSLMATFYLASLLVLPDAGDARPRARRWASAALFALALGVRETAATLPLAAALFAWFRGRSPRDSLRGLGAHGGVLLAAAVAALWLPGYPAFFSHSLATRGLAEQLPAQAMAHGWLLLHGVFDLRGNLDPDIRVGSDAAWLLPAACLLAAVAIALRSRRTWPWLGFGIAWYLLQLAPGNSLLPRFDLANQRHLYLALPGLALVGVVALRRQARPRLAAAALGLLALVLGGATALRNADYRSETALWTATVAVSPAKPRPWNNLGWARQQAGDLAGARAAYDCALALDPGYGQARINRSLLPAGAGAAPAQDLPACPADVSMP